MMRRLKSEPLGRLVSIPENPVPEGATVGILDAGGGARLRYALWEATGDGSKGTVCLLQGRTEFIEKYFEVVGELRARGFAVATFDWRGQGGSTRLTRNPRKGHVGSFEDYLADFDSFTREILLPDCLAPFYLLAHSTGGNIALRAATRRPSPFERIVLSAPLLDLARRRLRTQTLGRIAAILTYGGLGRLSVAPGRYAGVPRRFEGNPLTSDPARFARMRAILDAAPELGVAAPTFGWLHAAIASMKRINAPDFAERVTVPTLMLVGTRERIVSVAAIEALGRALKAGGTLVLPGARHELLMEHDAIRECFWAAFDEFIPGAEEERVAIQDPAA